METTKASIKKRIKAARLRTEYRGNYIANGKTTGMNYGITAVPLFQLDHISNMTITHNRAYILEITVHNFITCATTFL